MEKTLKQNKRHYSDQFLLLLIEKQTMSTTENHVKQEKLVH